MKSAHLEPHAREIFQAGVNSVLPDVALSRQDVLSAVGDACKDADRIAAIALGKASTEMAAALIKMLPESPSEYLIISHEIYGRNAFRPVSTARVIEAGHPQPDDGSIEAGRAALELCRSLGAGDLLIALISGGGSAMLAGFADGIALTDAAATTRALLASGADISEINCIRKHLSTVAGGRLAAAAYPAKVLALAISDVPGDDPSVIASGPFTADESTFSDALEIVHRRSVRLPSRVIDHLERGARGETDETIKPDDHRLENIDYRIIASNEIAVDASLNAAETLGYVARRGPELSGEAGIMGERIAQFISEAPSGSCIVLGGETTVTLGANPGQGGRNQELTLATALVLDEADFDWCVIGAGTDGIDGVTDVAGACITSEAWKGVDRQQALVHLRCHDAYPLLQRHKMIVETGPTGTNVMDLVVCLRE
jgi:glycerate 2-kinase